MSNYFKIEEIACPHVYKKLGQAAWSIFDSRLLITIETLRQRINKPIFINNWQNGGEFSQRGFRCLQCDLVKKAIADNNLYISPHMTGQAVDFDVEGLEAEEVRLWIYKNKNIWPYPIRLESGVSWVHLDTRENEADKVYIFKTS